MKKKIFKISDEEIKRLYLEGSSMSDIAKIEKDKKGNMANRNRLISLAVNNQVS